MDKSILQEYNYLSLKLSIMKGRIVVSIFLLMLAFTSQSQQYEPTAANKEAREWFAAARFGMFIHWGPFSIPGSGEWVMNNRNITVENYTRLKDFFNPIEFDAAEWVSIAKNAGMKYITLINRHHDGFSMWDTKYSDFNIMNTPYKKDIVRMIADECHKQGIKIFFYYSLLDWRREDYPHETGRTGQGTGRKGKGDYASYLQFMKNQLTELLTNYGEVAGIWFDGHWDQTNPEGDKDRTSRIDWKYDEISRCSKRICRIKINRDSIFRSLQMNCRWKPVKQLTAHGALILLILLIRAISNSSRCLLMLPAMAPIFY